jgi:rhomboid family GlyGly-CTERM serine protease
MTTIPAFLRFRPLGLPLGLGFAAVLAAAGGDPVRLAMRYERVGLASGEVWRLITGHLVHLGWSHTAMNLAALAVLSYLFLRLMRPLDWFTAAIVSALTIDAGLYWLNPTVEWYVGLSGLLHGWWAAACVLAFRHARREAWVLSSLIVLKLAYEAIGGLLSLSGQLAGGPVIETAHLYGAAGGVLSALLTSAIRSVKRSL